MGNSRLGWRRRKEMRELTTLRRATAKTPVYVE
jgi:hypothetical protein